MGGMLVSGSIASGAEYFGHLRPGFADALDGQANDTARRCAPRWRNWATSSARPQPAEPPPNHIHLADAPFFSARRHAHRGQPTPVARRIAAVDGFILGRL